MMGFGKPPTSLPILKSLFSVVAEILKGNPKILESSPAYSHAHFSSECDFMMALGKLKHIPHLKSLASAVAEIL